MKKFKILIPVYNDWQSLSKLLNNIDNEIQNINHQISVIVVDDASTFDRQLEIENLSNITSIKILIMKENRGHARCNATGLKYINEKEDYDYISLMDGDGEDRPEEIRLMIEKIKEYPDKVITANRVKRSEGFVFKLCYFSISIEL